MCGYSLSLLMEREVYTFVTKTEIPIPRKAPKPLHIASIISLVLPLYGWIISIHPPHTVAQRAQDILRLGKE